MSKLIGVVGLGYVGLPLAIEFGKARRTIGFDIDDKRIAELLAGVDATLECDADQIVSALHLEYTSDIKKLMPCNIYIVTVPTPIDDANNPDLTAIKEASKMIASILKRGDIVIYESTVYPGATEEICVPLLEESGLVFNEDFFCGYSPERINPGDKVHTLTKIKKITSGSNDSVAAEIDELYSSIIEAGTFRAPSIKVAEAAKVIENSQRDLNIAFVNELSLIFDRLGIDTLDVLEAAGTKWNFMPFRPGLVGGHCIGVDPYYLTYKAEMTGYHPQVILAGRKINDDMARLVANSIVKRIYSKKRTNTRVKVAVLGLTFKDNCPDTRNSKVFDLIHELLDWNINVCVYDPYLTNKSAAVAGLNFTKPDNMTDIDCFIFAVAHNEFKSYDIHTLCNGAAPTSRIIADLKGMFDREKVLSAGFDLIRL